VSKDEKEGEEKKEEKPKRKEKKKKKKLVEKVEALADGQLTAMKAWAAGMQQWTKHMQKIAEEDSDDNE
jgi:hypothetical protein